MFCDPRPTSFSSSCSTSSPHRRVAGLSGACAEPHIFHEKAHGSAEQRSGGVTTECARFIPDVASDCEDARLMTLEAVRARGLNAVSFVTSSCATAAPLLALRVVRARWTRAWDSVHRIGIRSNRNHRHVLRVLEPQHGAEPAARLMMSL